MPDMTHKTQDIKQDQTRKTTTITKSARSQKHNKKQTTQWLVKVTGDGASDLGLHCLENNKIKQNHSRRWGTEDCIGH